MICEAHPPDAATDGLGGRDITPYLTPVDGRPYEITVIKEPSDELDFASGRYTDLSHLPAPPWTPCCTTRRPPAAT